LFFKTRHVVPVPKNIVDPVPKKMFLILKSVGPKNKIFGKGKEIKRIFCEKDEIWFFE
jgi:hypothetical protein